MKVALIVLAALSFSLPAWSQTPARIALDKASIGIFPQGWIVVPVPESTFLMVRDRKTETAYTDLTAKVTFVRERYILTAPSQRLRHTLLHEAGHIQCQCADEHKAEMWANHH